MEDTKYIITLHHRTINNTYLDLMIPQGSHFYQDRLLLASTFRECNHSTEEGTTLNGD